MPSVFNAIANTVALATTIAAGPSRVGAQQPVIPELDAFVRSIVNGAAPLALAVVVVRGDSVVHLAGYGLRDVARSLPVTAQSPFYIASSTKSFTALTAAILASRGVVDLDAPVTKYVPEFRLPSPLDASRVTLRRLLSHRGGFESAALSFRTAFVGDLGADSLLAVLARDAVPVDTTFTYTNTAFIVAARVLERVTGTKWQSLVAREVLVPLGVKHSTAVPSSAANWELVTGYGPGPDGFRPVPMKSDATMHAAGGMLMSVEDVSRWLIAQLNDGRVAGRQLFPAAVIGTTQRRHATYEDSVFSIRRVGYGLGWQLGIENGDTLHHHFGNYPGAFAHVSFMRSRGVGVAVFTNSEMPGFTPVSGTIAMRAYDLLAGRHDRDDAHKAFADSMAGRTERMAEIFRGDHRRRVARPRVPPRGWAAYVGAYRGGDLGTVIIEAVGDSGAQLRLGTMRQRLEVFSGDTLRVEIPPGRSGGPLPVMFGPDGFAASIQLFGMTFMRQPDERRPRDDSSESPARVATIPALTRPRP